MSPSLNKVTYVIGVMENLLHSLPDDSSWALHGHILCRLCETPVVVEP